MVWSERILIEAIEHRSLHTSKPGIPIINVAQSTIKSRICNPDQPFHATTPPVVPNFCEPRQLDGEKQILGGSSILHPTSLVLSP